MTLSINDIQHNALNVIVSPLRKCYAECRYAECRYTECRGDQKRETYETNFRRISISINRL